jgi:putative membrane-bound dehydrogenase-like protein
MAGLAQAKACGYKVNAISLMRFLLIFVCAGAVGSLDGGTEGAPGVQAGFRVPPGFEVTEFADSRLANDIFSIAIGPRGRVVVSGPGYIRILVDDDGDGKADRAIDFADGPKEGAQGLLWEGSSLYFTGDGGLRRYRNVNGDGRARGPSELIRAMRTGGEHNAHSILRGPDGWLYVLCGNSVGIDKTFAQLPTSPIKEPVAGCVLRFSPELRASEIVADGFRNAYRMDFNADGELFTFDSDNERCVSLPWYEPTRFYHVVPGGHYGWQAPQRAETWRMPPYFCDVVPPIANLGRGSPTGVVCYRHTQFPAPYQGGFFLLDWTFGRVYFVSLQRAGATYTARKQVFLESVGDNGFAPTDAVVHPATGDLFISIGGRGTRGAVYRVRYPGGLTQGTANGTSTTPIPHRSLEWRTDIEKTLLECASRDELSRRRALDYACRHQDKFPRDRLLEIVRENWGHSDRDVRAANARLIASLSPSEQRALAGKLTPVQEITRGLGSCATDPPGVVSRAAMLLADRTAPAETRLSAVRLIQLGFGDLMARSARGTVWEGYSARCSKIDNDLAASALPALRSTFPAGAPDLDREISRTLAMIEDDAPHRLPRVMGLIDPSSDPVSDIHYLIVFARLRSPRTPALTRAVADALLRLDQKLTERHLNRDRNWPLRVGELYAELARKDPQLHDALLSSPDFGRPDHTLFALSPGFDRKRAAEVFLARARRDETYPWSAGLVALVGALPDERSLPVFRGIWGKVGVDEAILLVLARHAHALDRGKFLDGLNSPQLATVRLCLRALDRLPTESDRLEILALIRALRRQTDGREEKELGAEIAERLRRLTHQDLGTDREAWADWFTRKYPDLASQLGNADGVDVAGWSKRLAKVDWSGGEPERGHAVYVRATCASCHSGPQTLGPDLHGVASRFSRADLFTAILQPSKDVSPRYRTLLVATADGKVYQGLVIYEAVDSLLLQTGAATTVRIAVDQIVTRRFTPTSLMPAGLLDKLTDREIADLYAYLRSLGSENRQHDGATPAARVP